MSHLQLTTVSKYKCISIIGIPDFASFEYPDIKNGDKVLNPEKYESTNSDINTATGMVSNSKNENFASSQLKLQLLYKKIGILLEKIEEVYNQLIEMILGKRGQNYIFEYSKDMPLSRKEKMDILMKLHNMEGFSLKHVIDQLDDVEWESYIEQSLYEQEVMKLKDKIVPYSSAYTSTESDNKGGTPKKDDEKIVADSTINDRTTGDTGGDNI